MTEPKLSDATLEALDLLCRCMDTVHDCLESDGLQSSFKFLIDQAYERSAVPYEDRLYRVVRVGDAQK